MFLFRVENVKEIQGISSQRWKLDNLTRLTSSVEKNDETSLVKWTTLEILALVFSLTPRQKEKFFRLYFSASDYDDLIFK